MIYRIVYHCVRTIAVLAALVSTCVASNFFETDGFAPIAEQVKQYTKRYGSKNVLFVVDVDNTLLAMDRQLGSDQWFEWQEHLLEHKPGSRHLVADDFSGLLEAQGLLFAIQRMHPPEAEIPREIAKVQGMGVDTLVLTSRGDEFRAATIRELHRAGYDFAGSAPPIKLFARQGDDFYETGSRFTPYDTREPSLYGLRAEEVAIYKLPDEPRPVSYGDGVLMTAGQHKGAMLLVFLHLVQRDYDAIIYVDDHDRHASRVYDAMARRGIEATTFHYTHEDPRVEKFKYGGKRKVTREWQKLAEVLGLAAKNEPAAATDGK